MKQAKRSNHHAYVPVDIMAKYGAMLDEAGDRINRRVEYNLYGTVSDVRVGVPGNKVFACEKCKCPVFKLYTRGGKWYECTKCGAEYESA